MTDKLDTAIDSAKPEKKKRGWFGWLKRDNEEFAASAESDEYQFIKHLKNPVFYTDPEVVQKRYQYLLDTYP